MVSACFTQNSTNATKMVTREHFQEKEENNVMIISSTKNNIPVELYSLIWWILVASEEELQTEVDYLSEYK